MKSKKIIFHISIKIPVNYERNQCFLRFSFLWRGWKKSTRNTNFNHYAEHGLYWSKGYLWPCNDGFCTCTMLFLKKRLETSNNLFPQASIPIGKTNILRKTSVRVLGDPHNHLVLRNMFMLPHYNVIFEFLKKQTWYTKYDSQNNLWGFMNKSRNESRFSILTLTDPVLDSM